MKSHYDYCIVGAGPSGLTAAYRLLQSGQSVLLIERDARVGGLAKSYNFGGHIFDTGPKRFHTDDPIVLDFIKDVTGNDFATIDRSTKVYFLNQYFEWPLRTSDLFKMPVGVAARCFFDLIKKKDCGNTPSFHQYINSKYGETLYRTFFSPYTQKFLRWDSEDIHSDWASTGINRTVIDSRIKSNTLFDIFKTLVLPTKVDTKFLYPNHGGFGGFFDRLLFRCQSYKDFRLLLSDSIVSIDNCGNGLGLLTRSDESTSCDQLIWTGNLNDLSHLLVSGTELYYLNTIFYNLICKEPGISNKRAQWIYVSKGDSLISRITCMKEFLPSTCPEGYYNIMCELTDSQRQPVYFANPQGYIDPILQELMVMKFLKGRKWVEDVKINAVIDTYPIYHQRYKKDFGVAALAVRKFSSRIHLLGRSGAFWYNNSDHSIRFAIELTEKLLGKQNKEFNYRQYFGGAVQNRAASPHGA